MKTYALHQSLMESPRAINHEAKANLEIESLKFEKPFKYDFTLAAETREQGDRHLNFVQVWQ